MADELTPSHYRWDAVKARPDYSSRPGPIYCVCGRPAPHAPLVASRGSLVTNQVDGIPWGFCSVGCFEQSADTLFAVLLKGRR